MTTTYRRIGHTSSHGISHLIRDPVRGRVSPAEAVGRRDGRRLRAVHHHLVGRRVHEVAVHLTEHFQAIFFSLFGNLKKFFYVVCFCLLLFKFETISDENNKKTLLLLLFGGSTDRVKRVKNNVLIKFERSSSDLSRFKVQKVFRPGKYFHSDWAKKKKNNNDDDDDRLQREQVNPGLNPDQI